MAGARKAAGGRRQAAVCGGRREGREPLHVQPAMWGPWGLHLCQVQSPGAPGPHLRPRSRGARALLTSVFSDRTSGWVLELPHR